MSVTLSAVGATLGLGAQTDFELLQQVESGLPVEAYDALLNLGLPKTDIQEHIIPARTHKHRLTQKRRTGQGTYSREESERILRAVRLVLRVREMYEGNMEPVLRWFREPKTRFHGRSPFQMLETQTGAGLVEEMILQAQHGMSA